jgi:hypothetical protein
MSATTSDTNGVEIFEPGVCDPSAVPAGVSVAPATARSVNLDKVEQARRAYDAKDPSR